MTRIHLVVLLVVFLLFAAVPPVAGAIALDTFTYNLSFEIHPPYTHTCCSPVQRFIYQVPGWNFSSSLINAFPAAVLPPLDGVDVLEMVANGHVSQQLPVSLLDNTDYSFTVWVGRRLDAPWSDPNTYQIQLVTSGGSPVILGTLNGTTATIQMGKWRQETLTFNSGVGVAGLNPVVHLLSGASPHDVAWDYVPEPSTYLLMASGLLGIAGLRRRLHR